MRRRRARRRPSAALVGGRAARTARCSSARAPVGSGSIWPRAVSSSLDGDVSHRARARGGRRRRGGLGRTAAAYIWTRKQAGIPVRGRVARARRGCGASTAPTASSTTPPAITPATPAGAGRPASVGRAAASGWPGTWSRASTTPPRPASGRVWVDGEPHEVGPQPFAEDLSSVGGLRFTPWCEREDHTNRLAFPERLPAAVRNLRRGAARWTRARVGARRDGVARRALVRPAQSIASARAPDGCRRGAHGCRLSRARRATLGDAARGHPSHDRGQRRLFDPHARRRAGPGERWRGALRLRTDVPPPPPLDQGRRSRSLSRRDAARAGAARRLPELPHAARPRARDPKDGLGRLQHGVQSLPRRRPERDRVDDRRPARRGDPVRRDGDLGAWAPAFPDPRVRRRQRSVPRLHRCLERPARAAPVLAQLGQSAPHPRPTRARRGPAAPTP